MAVSTSRFQELLARAKAKVAEQEKEHAEKRAAEILETMSANNCEEVTLTNIGISDNAIHEDESVDIIAEIITDSQSNSGRNNNDNISNVSLSAINIHEASNIRNVGVARDILLNKNQQQIHDIVLEGKDAVLIGAAGTGKTTSMKKITRSLIDTKHIKPLVNGTRWLIPGLPGAAILSYTRKAVNNIRRAVVDELKPHTLTIHKILEFQPNFYEVEDPNNPGNFKTTMRFEPTKGRTNPLPKELTFIAFEESSMISTELYDMLEAALPHKHQELFLGDIQQLPPIFGTAILIYKMDTLNVVELTEIYRQAKESPIISLAWAILSGDKQLFSPKTIPDPNNPKKIKVPALDAFSRKVYNEDGSASEVVFQPWQKTLNVDNALLSILAQFKKWEAQGFYNPEEDIILCPFNKGFGTVELNLGIANYLGKKRNAEVYEVIAGFQKHYLAIGDRVLYDKEDAYITAIRKNGNYMGKEPLPSHVKMDRTGHIELEELTDIERMQLDSDSDIEMDMEAIESFLASAADVATDRVNAASHVIEIRYAYADETDTPIALSSAAEINNLLGGYAVTFHKFQGSENERVFLLLHNSHSVMVSRELLYTGVTRARSYLHVICERDTFYKGVNSQRIKGNTIKEKVAFFKEKIKGKETEYKAALEAEEIKKMQFKLKYGAKK